MTTRLIRGARVVLILGGASSAAFAQERGGATAASRTLVACVASESDYARTNAPEAPGPSGAALVLADVGSGRPLLNVTGLREEELSRHLGRRVEITGEVEQPRTTPLLTTAEGSVTGSVSSERPPAAGVTPDGAAAHEPSDALADTVAARSVAEPSRVSDPAYLLGLLPRLRATTFRLVEGGCVSGAAVRAQETPPAEGPVGGAGRLSQVAPARALEPVSVRGCLVRQTAGGTALSAQSGASEPLVLTDAAVLAARATAGAGAVPGSVPTDTGSGTVPNTANTAGQAPVDAATVSFQLVMTDAQRADLTARVGERIEVIGQLEDDSQARSRAGAAQPQPQPAPGRVQVAPVEVAHVSTPARRLTVTSFRAVGGTCH